MSKVCIGLLADSHIPDRQRKLHTDMLQRFREEEVELILHAGDISLPRALRELEEIAPVQAVRGNYDFFFWKPLPMTRVIEIEGVRIGITHGHGGLWNYIEDKFNYLIGRYKGVSFFAERAESLLPDDVDVVCFGHSHYPMQKRKGRKLIVNPGSCATHLYWDREQPSFGLLHVEDGQVEVEIIALDPKRFEI